MLDFCLCMQEVSAEKNFSMYPTVGDENDHRVLNNNTHYLAASYQIKYARGEELYQKPLPLIGRLN